MDAVVTETGDCQQHMQSRWDLWAAAESGSSYVVAQLIAAHPNIDVNARDHRNGTGAGTGTGTAIMYAADRGHEDVIAVLLAHGADVHSICYPGGPTALMWYARSGLTDTVAQLIRDGADVNAQDMDGRTALMMAAKQREKNTSEMLALLLAHNANVNATSKSGGTALMTAAHNGGCNAVELLLSHRADVNAQNILGETALILTTQSYSPSTVAMLLAHGAAVNISKFSDNITTALMWAAYRDDGDVLEMLIASGADMLKKDADGHTALYWAAREHNLDAASILLMAIVRDGYQGDLELLLASGDIYDSNRTAYYSGTVEFIKVQKEQRLQARLPYLQLASGLDLSCTPDFYSRGHTYVQLYASMDSGNQRRQHRHILRYLIQEHVVRDICSYL